MVNLEYMWNCLPENFILLRGEVHIWFASLDKPVSIVESLIKTLSKEELDRARRYYFPRLRKRFIVSHGLLRCILSKYLSLEPDQLQFSHNSFGKPSLPISLGKKNLSFNMSHSGSYVLYAITLDREIGVDIEQVHENFEWESIASSFFSSLENQMLQEVPQELKYEAFFNCWTRKEAYIKARGNGFSYPLDRFAVSLISGEPVALLMDKENPTETSRWKLEDISPVSGYKAALAVQDLDMPFIRWQLLE